MNTQRLSLLALIPALVLTSACGVARRHEAKASTVPPAPISQTDSTVYFGKVSSIEVVDGNSSSGVGGAVLGAVVGGVIGHQIGSGTGRDVATGVGAVGGALLGHSLQKRKETDIYRIVVTLDNGGKRSFEYQRIDGLAVGDRIKIEGGQLVRL